MSFFDAFWLVYWTAARELKMDGSYSCIHYVNKRALNRLAELPFVFFVSFLFCFFLFFLKIKKKNCRELAFICQVKVDIKESIWKAFHTREKLSVSVAE